MEDRFEPPPRRPNAGRGSVNVGSSNEVEEPEGDSCKKY